MLENFEVYKSGNLSSLLPLSSASQNEREVYFPVSFCWGSLSLAIGTENWELTATKRRDNIERDLCGSLSNSSRSEVDLEYSDIAEGEQVAI